MFYAARGQHPAHAPHPAPRARRLALCRGAVRRRGIHRPHRRCSTTSPRRRGPTGSSAGAEIRLEEADDGYHHHRLIDAAGRRAARRRDHRPDPAVLQQRHRDGRRPPGRGDARDASSTATARPTSCSTSTRAGPARHGLRADPLRPGRLPRPPDRHDLAAGARRGQRAADALPRVPVRDRGRRSAIATTTASCSSTRPYSQRDIRLPDEVPARTDEGDFRSTSRCATG